ncbi:MAG: hypothetical protein R3F11_01870 [Verrucomicrobiales bacterium]
MKSYSFAEEPETAKKQDRFRLTLRLFGGISQTWTNVDIENGEMRVVHAGKAGPVQQISDADVNTILALIVALDLLSLDEESKKSSAADATRLNMRIEYGQLKLKFVSDNAGCPEPLIKFILMVIDSEPVRERVLSFRLTQFLHELDE